ncbi:hypothetical protein SUNI508_13924 [Seiridium unicorne]
MENN